MGKGLRKKLFRYLEIRIENGDILRIGNRHSIGQCPRFETGTLFPANHCDRNPYSDQSFNDGVIFLCRSVIRVIQNLDLKK